ncbi:MAG: hypothetical protein ACRD0Z_00290 [Acidimicrobiales bacterium]
MGDGSHRILAAGTALVVLAGLLVAGATVRNGTPAAAVANARPLGALPAASLTSRVASFWACPGPLPAGSGQRHSEIEVVDSGPRRATARLTVAAVAQSGSGGAPLRGWSESVTVGAGSSTAVALATSGTAQNDAVSVESESSALAVFEAVVPAAAPSPRSVTPAVLQSPCELGVSRASYIPSGSTLGGSTVLVSVYDPTATEAVVGISVSSGSSSVEPPALQGLTIRPYTVQTFELGKWVVQQPTVAVAVTATVGQVAVGTSESQSSTGTTGQALEIGVDQVSTTWMLAPGLAASGRTIGVRVFDPSPRATTVTISSPVQGAAPVELTASVPARGAATVQLPVAAASSGAHLAAPTEGAVVVRSSQGVGVVVARLAATSVHKGLQAVSYLAVTAEPSTRWALPALGGAGETVVAVNPGGRPVTIVIEVAGSAGAAPRRAGQMTVPADSSAALGLPAAPAEVLVGTSAAPVVVEGAALAHQGGAEAAPGWSTPVEAVPVVG